MSDAEALDLAIRLAGTDRDRFLADPVTRDAYRDMVRRARGEPPIRVDYAPAMPGPCGGCPG